MAKFISGLVDRWVRGKQTEGQKVRILRRIGKALKSQKKLRSEVLKLKKRASGLKGAKKKALQLKIDKKEGEIVKLELKEGALGVLLVHGMKVETEIIIRELTALSSAFNNPRARKVEAVSKYLVLCKKPIANLQAALQKEGRLETLMGLVSHGDSVRAVGDRMDKQKDSFAGAQLVIEQDVRDVVGALEDIKKLRETARMAFKKTKHVGWDRADQKLARIEESVHKILAELRSLGRDFISKKARAAVPAGPPRRGSSGNIGVFTVNY